MKDEKQLVLFFKKGTEVDGTDLAAKLSKKFEFLKDPIVLPFDSKNPNQPLVIFNRGIISLTIGIVDVSFVYNSEVHKEMYDDIMDIILYLEDLDYSFERMGYISTFLHSKKDKENFKKNMFKDDVIDSEFQLSWYKKELIDSVSVNVWQKGITDTINGVEFVSIFDINTPIDESYNITSEFLRDFSKKCDKYIKEKEELLK
jgi:hypothetical protein